MNIFLFSEFVSTQIIHDLYQLCCSKRFSANPVEKLAVPPRTTLYKYLVIPKEGQPPPPNALDEPPKTPTYETRPTTNPFATQSKSHPPTTIYDQQPPEVKRRISHNSSSIEHEPRARSDTLPFLEQTEPLQHISTMRSGNQHNNNNNSISRRSQLHPKYDVQEEQEEQ